MEEGGTEPSDDFRFYLGRVITFIFIGEFILKLIAMGFAFGKGAYLKDNWNKLDFVVVATG
jgi:fumarate reductase subunit C